MDRLNSYCLIALFTTFLGCASESRVVGSPRPASGASSAEPTFDLGGAWSYHVGDLAPTARGVIPQGAPQMRVPSNWFTEGVDHAGVMWFFREVDLGASGEPVVIRFEAVDYAAEVYWDGARIAAHRGYFAPFVAQVPEGRRTGRHVLAVRVDSPKETAEAWSLHKTLIKGVLGHHDTRPGGAWSVDGQDANTGGIWGAVSAVRVKNAQIDDVSVVTETLDATRARLRISANVSHLRGAVTASLVIRGPDGRPVASGDLGRIERDGPVIAHVDVPNPRVWWPLELGKPELHTVRIELEGASGTDVESQRFGIRTVVRDANHRILVNGVPIFLRGTNWIGSLYYASFGDAAIRRDLALMQKAHVNAVRVHAHIASSAFYAACDEAGMMVWQDFPLQWGYDDSPAFADDAARQAREMVSTLGAHPSVIHWASMNEAPWSSDWMVWKYKDYDADQNRLLARVVRDAIIDADPSRPTEGNAHPAEHAWSGWYEGKYTDFAKPTPHPIVTEYGAQAVPTLATLRTFLGDDELWPLVGPTLEKWEYHNFQMRELREIAHVALGSSVEELITNTQAYQARVTQFAAENLRRQKWQPVTGIFQFMFVEHWASMNWGVVDYLRNPKPGYDALARAYQPTLPILVRKPNAETLTGYVINDARTPLRGSWLVARTPRQIRRVLVDVAADDVSKVTAALDAPAPSERLDLELEDASGRVVATNTYAPGYFTTEVTK